MHHPKADMDRMYLLRNEDGGGLIQLQTAYKTATIGLDTYLDTKNDPLLVIAKEPEKKKKNKEKSIHILPGYDFQFSTSLKHWNLRMKLWLSMPEKLDRKQGAMPKINWNKNVKINQCMGNTKKSKGKRCGPSKWPTKGWRQLGTSSKQAMALLLLPKIRPSRPTTIVARS